MNISEQQLTLINCAMAACAERGWRELSMADIAERAEISEAELHEHFANKTTLLHALFDYLDESLQVVDDLEEETVRERLFAIMMERLDLASPYRPALIKMRDEGLPKAVMCRAQGWLTKLPEAAGASKGWQKLHAVGLGVIWMMILPVWFADESADLTPTMAALDTHLGHAENLWQTVQGWRANIPI